MSATRAFVDGKPASTAALIRFARSGYGHFTTMQVRGGGVRGLGLHLARLEQATALLFDAPLELALLRGQMRAALAASPDASLRIRIGARNFNARAMPAPARIETLLLVDPPAPARTEPVRLASFQHLRYLPQLTHCGNFDLFELRRRALALGFEDALLLDAHGHIAEGTTFNIGFFRGDDLIWPQAEKLEGTTQQLLQRGFAAAGGKNHTRPITQADLASFDGGFCCHSGGIWPLATIDTTTLPLHVAAMDLLQRLWAEQTHDPV